MGLRQEKSAEFLLKPAFAEGKNAFAKHIFHFFGFFQGKPLIGPHQTWKFSRPYFLYYKEMSIFFPFFNDSFQFQTNKSFQTSPTLSQTYTIPPHSISEPIPTTINRWNIHNRKINRKMSRFNIKKSIKRAKIMLRKDRHVWWMEFCAHMKNEKKFPLMTLLKGANCIDLKLMIYWL